MKDDVTEPRAYEFEGFRLDLRHLALTRGSEAVPLERKAFDVLRVLVENRDRLVTKDELMEAVWQETFVTPNVLTRAVAQLRKALGDDAREARFIQTSATRGYRFIAPITVVAAATALPARSEAPEIAEPPARAAAAVPRPGNGRTSRSGAAAIVALFMAIGAGAVWLFKAQSSIRDVVEPLRSRRVTARNGYHGMAALSRDGRLIAYSSERDSGLEIVVSGLEPGSRELLITSDGGQNMQPDWSPDGQWLAFHSRKRGGIWIVPSTGGTARQLAEFGSEPAWSPDGERLIFASDAGGMAAQSVLWTIRRDGSDRRAVTSLGQPIGGHHEPAYSWNGQSLAFIVRRGGAIDELWRLQLLSGQLTRLTTGPTLSEPKFSPDDEHVYWGGMTNTGIGGLYRLRLRDAGGQVVPVMTLNAGNIRGLSISQAGTAAFSVAASDSNLWTVRADSPETPPVKLTDDAGRITYPDYSSDGRIAFAQFIAGNPVASWVIAEDGGRRERLVPDLAVGRPQWVADGSKLLVMTGAEDHQSYLWVDAATRRTTPVPLDSAGMRVGRVSPDGHDIAYHVIDTGGVMNVFRRPLDGGPAVQLTHDREAVSYPAWSRDQRWLAVEIKRGGMTHIGVVPSAGGPAEQITFADGQSWPHSWSADNEHIAFAGQRDGVWNVWTVSRRTKQVRQLTHFVSAAGYVRYPSWSPRGDRIVFERNVESASVWTVDLK